MLKTGEVIRAFDRTTSPPKHRMLVCLSFVDGWFLRVTTNKWRPAVAIDKARNPWLDHDSHVECTIQEWDEYEIDDALKRGGVIGMLHADHFGAILAALLSNPYTAQSDKTRLSQLLT